MKKLLILVSVFILGISLCGCTKVAENICENPKEWDVMDVSVEHVEYLYNYNMQCVVNPSYSKREYTPESLDRLTMLADKFEYGYMDNLPNKEELYKEVILKLFITYFGEVAFNTEAEFAMDESEDFSYCHDYDWYLSEAKRLYSKEVLYNELNSLITHFKNVGYLNNNKIVWLLGSKLNLFIINDSEQNDTSIYEGLSKALPKYVP